MSQKTLTCEEAIHLLVEYLDGELDAGSRGDLERHLDICRSCYSRHEFESGLKERVAGLAQEPVRAEFQNRIRTLIDRFGQDAPEGQEDRDL